MAGTIGSLAVVYSRAAVAEGTRARAGTAISLPLQAGFAISNSRGQRKMARHSLIARTPRQKQKMAFTAGDNLRPNPRRGYLAHNRAAKKLVVRQHQNASWQERLAARRLHLPEAAYALLMVKRPATVTLSSIAHRWRAWQAARRQSTMSSRS